MNKEQRINELLDILNDVFRPHIFDYIIKNTDPKNAQYTIIMDGKEQITFYNFIEGYSIIETYIDYFKTKLQNAKQIY